jgi:hypothetical protein
VKKFIHIQALEVCPVKLTQINSANILVYCLIELPITVGGLAKVAIFTTNFDTKHTLQIYEKLSYEALNRHFCQTAVISWPSVCRGWSLSAVSFAVIVELRMGLFVSAVGSGFKNFRREGNFKK